MTKTRTLASLLSFCVPLVSILVFLTLVPNATAQGMEGVSILSPQAGSVELVMTVGTNPAACATTKSASLPLGGGQATFCYEVTNTGDVSLTRHNLVDDRLGSLLTNFPYTLLPGNSAFLTQTATITATTTSTAIWTAFNPGPVDTASASDSVTVDVVVPEPAIALNMTVGEDPGVCAATKDILLPEAGGQAVYCYEVTNTGNVALTQHILEDDRLGSLLMNFPYTLLPGNSAFLTQTATITTTTTSNATWTAANPGLAVTANDSDSVMVELSAPSIVMTHTVGTDPAQCAATKITQLPIGGGSVTYCYRATNTGNVALTQHSLVDDALGVLRPEFPFTLEPGASTFITRTAVITTRTVSSATWTAFNPGPVDSASDSDSATVDVEVAAPAIVMTATVGTDSVVCAETKSLNLPVGGRATYCYRVTNTGNVALTRHSLVDDILGTVWSDHPVTLLPGASTFVTQTAVIQRNTVNHATWTAFNPGPVDVAVSEDNAMVSVDQRVYLPLVVRP